MAVAVAVLVATGTLLAQATAGPAPASIALAERPAFSADNALSHLNVLSQLIGSRPAGSTSHEQAVGYVADTWRAMGYQSVIGPFQYSGFEEREVSLTVADSGDRIGGKILRGGIGGDVQAALVDVGLGRPQDFDASTLQGQIVLIKRGEIRFSDKLANVSAAGAIGAVIDNHEAGGFVGSLSGPATIPAIGISGDDGRALRRQMAWGPLVARLTVDGGMVQQTASNVSATKPGTGDGIVIIGGHIDSVSAGPGANDNAAGVAVLTELARAIQSQTYPFEIRLVAFGAEEIGLVGSREYVAGMSDADRQRVIGMINLDMIGVGSQLRFGGSPDLVGQAITAAASIGESATRMSGGMGSASDHASFIDAGMPGVFVYRSDDPNYHTANDRFEFISPQHIENTGRIVLALLEILAADATA
jgi:Zn-dependent M28 family amino/carboxypeptidase